MTQIKSHLLPSAIIKIQFNYVNCNATFVARRGREIYDCCSSQRVSEVRERNVEIYGSCLRFVNAEEVDCLLFACDIHTIPSPRMVDVNCKREMIYNLSFQLQMGWK